MNELYAADPAACPDALALKHLLEKFGPQTGRYLGNYPNDWSARVRQSSQFHRPIEAERIKSVLRRADERTALFTQHGLNWIDQSSWINNALQLISRPNSPFKQIIGVDSIPPHVSDLHNLNLPVTAEERIAATPREYARVSEIFLKISHELIFIDPYLNPFRDDYGAVLKELFPRISRGRCRKIFFWARCSEIEKQCSASTYKHEMQRILKNTVDQLNFQINVILVSDERATSKMHGRYLVSPKGGIRFDQGFQRLPRGRLVDVGPISETVHEQLMRTYSKGANDFEVIHRFCI